MGMTDAEVLDCIARLVVPDHHGGWTDESGILETIGDLVRSTGRAIENWQD